jgi:hypothetical protein
MKPLILILALASCGVESGIQAPVDGAVPQNSPTLTAVCGTASTPPATYDHVIWIWFENHSYDKIIGSTSAPYINSVASECGLATNYHNVTHPSLPNYIAATSGATQGITSDGNPGATYSRNVASVFSQVDSIGKWRSYEESMPSNCDGAPAKPYAPKHNPAAYYTPEHASCLQEDVSLGTVTSGSLISDLASGALARFTFITPNLVDDMHNGTVAQGDAWLATWLPKIVGSTTYKAGKTAIFITWDEGSGGTVGEDCLANASDPSCHVATIVISPFTVPGTTSTQLFDHYSLLRTTEDMVGAASHLLHAGDPSTSSMRAAFHL